MRIHSAFNDYDAGEELPRQWVPALAIASVIFIGLAIAAGLAAGRKQSAPERAVDITFVEQVVKEEAPPPPPAQPMELDKPLASLPAAPVIPKAMKVRKLPKVPAPQPLLAPQEMPQQAPQEAEPSQDKGIAVTGEPGPGDAAGLEGGVPSASANFSGPIALPDDAVPPKPAKSNVAPAYPMAARRLGKSGKVTLRIVVTADGRVTDIEVQQGEEPFVAAAITAVRRWRYEPARYKGQAISVYRLVEIGFKLGA